MGKYVIRRFIEIIPLLLIISMTPLQKGKRFTLAQSAKI